MDTFGRCIPATNLAKDALNDFTKKDDKFGIQYSYLVLSINSEVHCGMIGRSDESEQKVEPEKYFIKAMEINTSQEQMASVVATLFQYLQS